MAFREYASYDALGLAELVRRKEVQPRELLEVAISRAEALNPKINAIVIPLFEEALRQVDDGLPDGPFAGVPFLVKDLHLQIAGTITTNGSRFFKDAVAERDSTLIERYRRAGLVIFGRSASPEFGLTTTTESALFGETRNPWALDRIAGGSSGGAAAAVAAGIVPLANASDGGGSIRIPASCCGLFGLKPTRMRVPLGPDRAEGWSGLSTVHAVSRSVRDNAALLDASAGPEIGDPYWAPPPARPYLQEVGVEPGRLRIALVRTRNDIDVDAECLAAVDRAAELCEALGHHVEEAAPAYENQNLGKAMQVVVSVAVRMTLDQRAKQLGRSLRQSDVEPVTWAMVRDAHEIRASALAESRETIHRSSGVMAAFQRTYDVILSPTLAQPPAHLGVLSLAREDLEAYYQELASFSPFTSLANMTGQPAMSVPLHWTAEGLPVGVMFAGRFGDEATLLRLASQLEQAQPWANKRPGL